MCAKYKYLIINIIILLFGKCSKIFHNLMLIFGEIWKKMEAFGKIWEVINKKRPEGRSAVHRGMFINVLIS